MDEPLDIRLMAYKLSTQLHRLTSMVCDTDDVDAGLLQTAQAATAVLEEYDRDYRAGYVARYRAMHDHPAED